MPSYNYHCNKCEEEFVIKATIAEKEENNSKLFVCPKCKSTDIRQNFGSVGGYIKGENNAPSCPTGTCPFMQ